jgi:DNA uptake protein ComE-like DNA-binding protein
MYRVVSALIFVLFSLCFLNACTSCLSSRERTPEEIRQQTAEATSKIKKDTVAVAQGIKEGLARERVDLNTATKPELTNLPGITDAHADKIFAARPFDNPDQLVTKRVLTQDEYDKIANRVTVKKK